MIHIWVTPATTAIAGFVLAWMVQSARLTEAELDHEKYVVELKRKAVEEIAAADKQREETSREFAKRIAQVKADGDAFRRCVAAGKCGVREPLPGTTCTGPEVQPAGGADAAGADAIPSPGVASAAAMSVVNDCAVTTLMLNELQADITKQLAR